jgi:preprotein translocase subunit Sec63
MWIRLQSGGGQEESVRDHRQPHDFPWFNAETDPSQIDRIYKFLKVAFHPDRFSSKGLKEEAKIHFQEAVQAYNALKERLRATH